MRVDPLIVHYPIALLSTALLFDVLGSFLKRNDLRDAGFWCMIMGTISCFFYKFL